MIIIWERLAVYVVSVAGAAVTGWCLLKKEHPSRAAYLGFAMFTGMFFLCLLIDTDAETGRLCRMAGGPPAVRTR